MSNSNLNTIERRLEVDDRVILNIDLNTNTDARRNAFDSFFNWNLGKFLLSADIKKFQKK
jgi:hypothetical protein